MVTASSSEVRGGGTRGGAIVGAEDVGMGRGNEGGASGVAMDGIMRAIEGLALETGKTRELQQTTNELFRGQTGALETKIAVESAARTTFEKSAPNPFD